MSITAASKQYAESKVRRSPALRCKLFVYARMKCKTLRWFCITPFGRPVEPDVYRMYARLLGSIFRFKSLLGTAESKASILSKATLFSVRASARFSSFVTIAIANEFKNRMGDLVGSRVQFRVGPFVIRGLDGDPRGIFSDLSFKAFRNRLL